MELKKNKKHVMENNGGGFTTNCEKKEKTKQKKTWKIGKKSRKKRKNKDEK